MALKDNLNVNDGVKVGISKKTPEQIEKIKRGDPEIDELKRRRSQTPQNWFPIAGNPEEVFDEIWSELKPGCWLRLVYSNGNLLTGKVKGVSGDGEITLEQDTILLNYSICNTDILDMAGADVIQVFVDDDSEAKRIRSQRG